MLSPKIKSLPTEKLNLKTIIKDRINVTPISYFESDIDETPKITQKETPDYILVKNIYKLPETVSLLMENKHPMIQVNNLVRISNIIRLGCN